MAQFEPARVRAAFAGIKLTGFMKGTFISYKRVTEKWSHEVGGQGDRVWIKSPDDSAMVEFTLQATSPTNKALSDLYKQDKKDNTGKGPLSISDLNTNNSLIAGDDARIVSCPDIDFADTLTPRVWKVLISKVTDEYIDGANS